MKIKCQHGFFTFEETIPGQISKFMSLTGFSIVPWRDKYTFLKLAEAPDYSISGTPYLGTTAIISCSGEPWSILNSNQFVYDFTKDLIVPIQSIPVITKLSQAGNVFVSKGLILPGSLTEGGQRIRDYSAWFSKNSIKFTYSEVSYV